MGQLEAEMHGGKSSRECRSKTGFIDDLWNAVTAVLRLRIVFLPVETVRANL
jgi:hypothetical protein